MVWYRQGKEDMREGKKEEGGMEEGRGGRKESAGNGWDEIHMRRIYKRPGRE